MQRALLYPPDETTMQKSEDARPPGLASLFFSI
jgi:hypothetical protein